MLKLFQNTIRNLIKRSIFPIFSVILGLTTASGQKHELGAFFGTSYYLGDLNPNIHFALPGPGLGVLYRHNFTDHLSARANGFYSRVAGNDASIGFDPNRNLQFRSDIIELSIQGEVNFLPFIAGDLNTPFTPFIFGGAGLFRYNPKAELNGQWHSLQPLKTEGQGSDLYPERVPYSLFSSNFLFGMGVKFNISSTVTGGFEWGFRRTGTDYLDDISTTYPDASVFGNNSLALQLYDRSLENRYENRNFQRGNPNSNDWYSFAGFVLTIRFLDNSRYRCPAYN
jgi:opacity protein-like surface antigen